MTDTMLTPERPSLKNLAAALCKAQAEMEGAKKDAKNPHFNSKYADLASVWDAIREPLTKNGLSVVQLPRSIPGGVEVETILLHVSGESLSSVLAVPATKSDAQGFGSALTYARRYSLMAMVGVAPEDDDGNAASRGAPGTAGGGGDFRPAGPRRFQAAGPIGTQANKDEAARDGLTANAKPKPLPAAAGARGATKTLTADEKAVKIKEATDKRIDALKAGAGMWTRETLDQFWNEDKKWIDWMADPQNGALKEYERFTNAFADAEVNMKEVA